MAVIVVDVAAAATEVIADYKKREVGKRKKKGQDRNK